MSEKKHDKQTSELALDLSGLQSNKTNDSGINKTNNLIK